MKTAVSAVAAAVATLALAGAAYGQASFPAVFVCNNGNLEGSVTTYRLHPDGSVEFVSKFVTGSRPNIQTPEPGANAAALSLHPSGRYIAVSHAAGNTATERITMLTVAPDGTLSRLANFVTPDGGLKIRWVNDELLAVTRITTDSGCLVYRFDPDAPSLTLVDDEPTGSFASWIEVSPDRRFIYASDSNTRTIRAMRVEADGDLETVDVEPTGQYPLGIGISPDGKHVYGAGGISANAVVGFEIDPMSGALTAATPGSPYTPTGSSPKQVCVTADGRFAAVGHGTDATVRMFARDLSTGALTNTGFLFDVGLQGTLGDITAHRNWIFFTDRSTATDGLRGLYSFTVNEDGSLTQNGPLVDSQGVEPVQAVVWEPAPACAADLDGDGAVGAADLAAMLGSWGAGAGPADLDGDGNVGASDLAALLGSWGPCA